MMKTGWLAAVIFVAGVVGAVVCLDPPPAIGSEATMGKRDLRAARRAVEEGRLQDGLTLYEEILDSALSTDPAIRAESLFMTGLIRLADEPDSEAIAVARDKLESLVTTADYEKNLELAALRALFDVIDDERLTAARLRELLADEQRQRETDRETAAVVVAKNERQIRRQRERQQALRTQVRDAARKLKSLERQLEDKAHELAERRADIDFLTEQLAGTHDDQAKMLEAVMHKNEELQAKERQLRATRSALETKADELSEKEEAIQKREDAIRQITER
ncbi:MAG: hypothetical protein OEM62_12670, partial [Acidobacteriota bacterium]|nr:hypothetical protein [Acidobacteriota bacterium]